MKKKPLTICLVVPAFNEADYLPACLEAIAAQTTRPQQVIVVDNGSTDQTVSLAKRYPFVQILHESTPGVLAARTRGFNAAEADIIGRIDADTRLNPTWVEQVLQIFQADEDLAAVSGPVQVYDLPKPLQAAFIDDLVRRIIQFGGKSPLLFGANMAVRQTAWRDVREDLCQRRDIHEDIDLAIHLTAAGHQVVYRPDLRPAMSSRRYDAHLFDFITYNALLSRSYEVHNLPQLGPWLAQTIYLASYFALWPLRRTYDVTGERRSFGHLLKGGNRARKNPMDS